MKRNHYTWLSITFNVILIWIIFIFILKYEVEEYVSEQFYPKEYEIDSVSFFWPEHKKMALSITFDDARTSQIDSGGIAIMDKYHVKGTFYVSPENIVNQIDEWKNAIKNGHEIGNHTTTHPCSINFGWQNRKTLENYSITDIYNDIFTSNAIIKKMLGVQPVSFAYPCGQTFVGQGLETKSYVPVISERFESGRLYSGGTVNPVLCDMAQLPSENLDNRSFDQIMELIENAKKTGKWLILVGHDVGVGITTGNDGLVSSKATIEAICEYAADPSNGIWVDNVTNITAYIKTKRGEKPFVHLSEYKKYSGSIYSKIWSIWYVWKLKLKHYKYVITQKLHGK